MVEVSEEAGSTGKTVRIKPAVDFLHLEEVLIVKEKTTEGNEGDAVTATPSATPSAQPSVTPTATPQETQ